MPSVFFVSLMSASPWGGSEELWYRTAMKALENKWTVGCAVYHWPEKEKRLEPLRNAGAQIIYLPNKGRSKKNLWERIQNKRSKTQVKKRIPGLPFSDYDLTVVNMGAFEITTPVWQGLQKHLNKYLVLYHNYREGEVFRGQQQAAIQQLADGAVVNLLASQRIAEVLKELSHIQLPRQEILLNPITFEAPAVPSPYPSSDKVPRFVMLAALEVDRKAQDELIRALSGPQWKDRNWQLHLYGSGKDQHLLEKLILTNGLEDKIRLMGHTANVKAVLQDAHLLLQITHQDAMPLSVVEAMAVGRPVVVSRIGDMPRWVTEGKNGWISHDARANSIHEVMEKAWSQKEQWATMGANAFMTFKERFPDSVEGMLLEKCRQAIQQG